MNFPLRDHFSWANQYHGILLNLHDTHLNLFHDRSRGRRPQDFQSFLISKVLDPNLKVGDTCYQSKHNSNTAFELCRLRNDLLYTLFQVLINLKSIKILIPSARFLCTLDLPTEFSLPPPWADFFVLANNQQNWVAYWIETWQQSGCVQPGAFGRRSNCSVSSGRMMVSASPRRTRHASASSWSSSVWAASWCSSLRRETVLLVMLLTGLILPASPLTPGISSCMLHRRRLFVCIAWFSQPASCERPKRLCYLELRWKLFEVLLHIGWESQWVSVFISSHLPKPVVTTCNE